MLKNFFYSALVVLIFLALTFSADALPDGFRVSEISSSTGPLSYQFYNWAAINENGQVCFKGASNASSASNSAIIRGDSTTLTAIARTDDGSGLFDQFTTGICSINDAGDVAFDGCRGCQPLFPGGPPVQSGAQIIDYGIYKRTNSGIPVTIQESGLGASDFKSVSLPIINSSGEVSFSGELNSGIKGIWIKSGISLLNPFDSSGFLSSLGGAFMNDSQQLVFGGEEDGPIPVQSGIYGPTANRIMGTFNGFSKVSLPVINVHGDIANLAMKPPPSSGALPVNGVYINNAPFILNTGDFLQVDISSFQAISMNDRGDVLFPAVRPNGNSVVFFAASGGMIPILEKGDHLPGHASPVAVANVSRESANNSRQIALAVVLQDGTNVVVRLDPQNVIFPDDLCPLDNTKFAPGACGCGVSDADSNGDGILNCFVTPKARELGQSLLAKLKLIKHLPTSASSAKKKAQKTLLSGAKRDLNSLYKLVKGSQSYVKLTSNRKTATALVTDVRAQVLKGLKTSDRNFARNKKAATRTLQKFIAILSL